MKNQYAILEFQAVSQVRKTELNQMWICRILAGKATISYNLREHEVAGNDCFLVVEGVLFRLLSSTNDMKMEVLVFESAMLNIVYPFLGSDVDWSKVDDRLQMIHTLEPPYNQLLLLDYDSLRCMIRQPQEVVNQKMMLSMVAHFLMTYYKAICDLPSGQESVGGNRSYQLLTRFYELLLGQKPLVHRDTPYYADKLNISVRHLFKICKSETGMTPKEIVNEFLVGEIKNVLLTSDLSHQQIADLYGFPDQSAFGQYFKRHAGMSPMEFRKRYS